MFKQIILFVTLLFSTAILNATEILTFGIVPQQSVDKMKRLWGPILKLVSEQSGLTIRFATAPDIASFEKKLATGHYDFCYLNPRQYVTFNKSQGYQAINKARDKKLKGIIVVARKGNLNKLIDLENLVLAFPSAAFAATTLTRNDLSANKVNYDTQYVKSHDAVYLGVAKGEYSGGGGVLRTFNNMHPEIREQLKIIWTTKGYTPHAIAVHPRVHPEFARKVQQAFIDLETTQKGKALLKNIRIKGFERAVDDNWDSVRELN